MAPAGRRAGARPGPPTLEEVAALAGLSRATVSRAVNGGLRVSPRAQRAVADAVRRLGYAPNRAAPGGYARAVRRPASSRTGV